MYSLDLEERGTPRHDRKIAADHGDDYEVIGLMCDSDGDDADVDALDVESQTDCFRLTGRLGLLEKGIFLSNRQVGHSQKCDSNFCQCDSDNVEECE